MTAPLAPNRIHSLPVQVNYHLPQSSQTFTTLFSTPQQVYVHPNAGGSSTDKDEVWGSIYLKTVVEGLLWASPELHPDHPNTPDLSLYILDPRETSLKRSRPPPMGSSPSLASQEVWTGKGLISWALGEPGVGKNLITGRLVLSRDFAGIGKDGEMSPMEALMLAQDEERWGIEISIGLKNGLNGPPVQVEQVQAKREVIVPITVVSSPPARSASYKRSSEKTKSSSKRRKVDRTRLGDVDPNISANRSSTLSLLSGNLYDQPDSLTKDQAQRLLASPAFLDMIQKLTSGAEEAEPVEVPEQADGLVCYNCGRTKSAVWRTKEMPDGLPRRLCNACGLYWNKAKAMRPPTMWEGVDDEVPRKTASTPGPSDVPENPPSRRSRADTPQSGFKRTLSLAAEKDAKRIAKLRSRPHVRSNLAGKGAMTSPPRGSASVSRGLGSNLGASSPGWASTPTVIPGSSARSQSSAGPSKSSSKTLQSLDLPLSDDVPRTDNLDFNFDTDLSELFDIEGFSMPQFSTGDDNPLSLHLTDSMHMQATSTSGDQDEVLSQLFNRTSSVGYASSPPFDFSQLPPSSPPMMPTSENDLPHSALVLSSPGFSPDFSPLNADSTSPFAINPVEIIRKNRIRTPEKSKLSRQISTNTTTSIDMLETAAQDQSNPRPQTEDDVQKTFEEMQRLLSTSENDATAFEALQELLRSFDTGNAGLGLGAMDLGTGVGIGIDMASGMGGEGVMESSAAVADGLCGDDDLFALLNESYTDGYP